MQRHDRRKTWPKMHVVARDVFQERLFHFHEESTEIVLTKPASINCELGALLTEGRQLLIDNYFEEAIALAQKSWPSAPASRGLGPSGRRP